MCLHECVQGWSDHVGTKERRKAIGGFDQRMTWPDLHFRRITLTSGQKIDFKMLEGKYQDLLGGLLVRDGDSLDQGSGVLVRSSQDLQDLGFAGGWVWSMNTEAQRMPLKPCPQQPAKWSCQGLKQRTWWEEGVLVVTGAEINKECGFRCTTQQLSAGCTHRMFSSQVDVRAWGPQEEAEARRQSWDSSASRKLFKSWDSMRSSRRE